MNRTIGLIDTNYAVPDFAELTDRRPPASLPFGARYRLIDFALSNLVNSRISTVGVVTPYYYRSLIDHIGAGKEWGLDRKEGGLFILPGSIYGARELRSRFLLRDLENNLLFLETDRADYVLCCDCSLVCNADHTDMIDQHELAGLPVTLLYKETEPGSVRPGLYLTLDDNGCVTAIEPGESGRYLFLNCFIADSMFLQRFVRDHHALNHLGFIDVLRMELGKLRVGSRRFAGYTGFMDTLHDYVGTSMDLLRREVRTEVLSPSRPISTKIHDAPPAVYADSARVSASLVSAGCVIEGTVENSILFRGVHVEKGAVVRNSVIMEHGVIRAGAELDWCVCDKCAAFSPSVVVRGTAEAPCLIPKGKKL